MTVEATAWWSTFMHLHQCVVVQPVTLLQYTEVEEWHSGEGPATLIM